MTSHKGVRAFLCWPFYRFVMCIIESEFNETSVPRSGQERSLALSHLHRFRKTYGDYNPLDDSFMLILACRRYLQLRAKLHWLMSRILFVSEKDLSDHRPWCNNWYRGRWIWRHKYH